MTKAPTDVGRNRTGITTAPGDSKALVAAAAEAIPAAAIDGEVLARERVAYSNDADPVGTMPPPASLKGVAQTAVQALKGEKANVLLDLIGERIAFERGGVRLYEALVAKLRAADPHPGGPTEAELLEIRNQELEHFQLVSRAMTQLGGDPTVVTPSADVITVASMGLFQVLADPRTTFNQGLKAILTAELADTEGWELLSEVALQMGHEDLANSFGQAGDVEEQHLVKVRAWLERAVAGEAGIDLEPAPPTSPTATAP